MASVAITRGTKDALQTAISELQPELKLNVRSPLFGGLSGADVFLVDFVRDSQRHLGVVKMTSKKSAEQEALGIERARDGWLGEFLPEHFEVLKPIDNKVPVLSALARDRLDDCRTLENVLSDSFLFGKDYILFSVAYAYRQEASKHWSEAVPLSPQECFQFSTRDMLGSDWLENWIDSGLPSNEQNAVVFEDLDDRWPNPIAYFLNEELWNQDADPVRVPTLLSHGDLNARNVLCVSQHRAYTKGLVTDSVQPLKMLEHVSLIDMPFCREMPFPFDLMYLLTSLLSTLLPSFEKRVPRENTITTFRAIVRELATGTSAAGVPADCSHFAQCCSTVWTQLRYAQKRIEHDIEIACLTCLASAALFRAIKAVNRRNAEDRDRSLAASSFCLSALALKELLRTRGVTRLPEPDCHFGLATTPEKSPAWSDTTRQLANRLSSIKDAGGLMLALGRDWAAYLDQPSDTECQKLRGEAPNVILDALEQKPAAALLPSLAAIGALEPTAILDWSMFRYPRDTVARALPAKRSIQMVAPSQSNVDWTDRQAVFYIHWRGSFENLEDGIGLTARERNQIRSRLRDHLSRLAKKRSQNQCLVYVGVPSGDVREMHEDLQQVWKHKLRSLFIGEVSQADEEYFDDWEIERLSSGIDDFLAACAGFAGEEALPTGDPETAQGNLLTIADVVRDDEGELTYSPGNATTVEIPDEQFAAISAAGVLFVDRSFEPAELSREPRDFFIGHRIEFPEVQKGIAVVREEFETVTERILDALNGKRPRVIRLLAHPGAGASTALRWLAYEIASRRVPTLVLSHGGNAAFEAIERLHQLTNRSMFVVVDTEDVSPDQLSGLVTRCGPPRYPVTFLSTQRVVEEPSDKDGFLSVRLSEVEKASLLSRLGQYCSSVGIGDLLKSQESSLFLLTLMAFGGEHLNVNRFVSQVLDNATDRQKFLIAVVAFFSRYGHRATSDELLEVMADDDTLAVHDELSPFADLLVLREESSWACRHDQLSEKVLQCYLTGAFDEQWRYKLAEFACDVFGRVDGYSPGGDLVADYVWSALNPQLDSVKQTDFVPRLIRGRKDGIPENPGRHLVYSTAAEQFPEHVQIVSHFGKFLSEEEKKFAEAEDYFTRALELDPGNEAVMHMLGKRYSDEVREMLRLNPPNSRLPESQERIDGLADAAHDWFDRAREQDLGSEYNYTTPMQLNIRLIQDEFRRLNVTSAGDDPAVLTTEKVSTLLSHTEAIASQGLNFISPYEDHRRYFTQARDELQKLRGDLETTIRSFEERLPSLSGSHRSSAQVQLARLYKERGEKNWLSNRHGHASKDFETAQRHIFEVLEDPARKFDNIRLWFDCARFMRHWTREDILDKLHQLHQHEASLDTVFLLMCLYFADAVETGSPASWRKYEEFQTDSARRSSNYAVRTYIREWLVNAPTSKGEEYRIYPNHLIGRAGTADDASEKSGNDTRVTLTGTVSNVVSSTVAFVKIQPMGFQLFFKPRVLERRFYKQDEGALVSFQVAFTYEKPIAYDVVKRAAD